jgi:exonuclease SbcC
MRPLQLSFSGIRSYPGAVEPLDFTGKTLIAVLGDTGAGKSTILEAISLALYGNCTWSNENRALMAEGAGQMTVDFTFAHDGHRWRVHRAYYSNSTPSIHLLQNLDTGEQVDNKRPVDRRVEALLQLSFESFTAAVLLPQGEFDKLLTATGGDRTRLLKSIFGTQLIEIMRTRAGHHRDQLKDLLHQAELARRGLLDDPAAVASREAIAAAESDKIAAELRQALIKLRAHHAKASAARARHTEVSAACDVLRRHPARDVVGELEQVSSAAADLVGREAQAAQARQQWTSQRDEADTILAAAAREGFTVVSLSSAATLLAGLPDRLDALAAGQVQLDMDTVAVAEEADQLGKAQIRLTDLIIAAGSLAEDHARASAELEELRQTRGRQEQAVRTLLLRAADAGKALRQEEAALRQEQELTETLAALGTAAQTAAGELRSAENHLSSVRSHEAAHTAGAALAPGDLCLICNRTLPDDYEPPEPADPAAQQAAERSLAKVGKADRAAADKLADAKAKANIAQQTHADRKSATETARGRLDQARQAAMRQLAQAQVGDGTASPNRAATEPMLEAACSQMADTPEHSQDELLDTLTAQLLMPSAAAEKELIAAAARADKAARKAETETATQEREVSLLKTAQEKSAAKLKTDRKRHQDTLNAATRDLSALPAQLRQMLPGELPQVTRDHAEAARQVAAQQQEQLSALAQLSKEAGRELEQVAEAERDLGRRRQSEVSDRLHSLMTYLERWQDVIDQAARVLPPNGSPVSVLVRPGDVSVDAVSIYATALAETDRTIAGSLTRTADAAAGEADAQMALLARAAGQLRTGKGIDLPAGDALLDPSGLDELVSAETNAREAARRHQENKEAAEGQMERAADLDKALGEGRSRLSAVEALRGLLADAKFLQYLIDQRTRALLAVASGTFSELTRGEFGFSPDFQVVSRRSGAARSPRTLSGGETFLASLALALALVELHSRSSGKLGALFLDEGFAALDVDLLAGALAVLQADTGGDRLVVVISHLHAVAEAVPDVMWVERGPAGSSVRWLSADERDRLVRQEVTSGLLNIL